ncbi:methionine synthase [Phormidium yuhuli AB48]|uniref:Methionine synthase n=1 Tax=Phormidium yuhuli AB48 TaxID=2940671 RepID=A0ABY5AQ25_9CYAN|nr:Npun_R2821/Npun_R2822 family protein [Phormidium yuhuli]USR91324.1 methionine synthase [Phormidium yuhuli AB48]
MQSIGIYTLANDFVYDQLIALLNSIEVNVSPEIPICIIPYDDRMDRVQREVESRPNVTLYDNQGKLEQWEEFSREIWSHHPKASQKRFAKIVRSKIRLQRKMVAFSGDFERFVFYDADTLAMKPLDDLFDKLETYDFVFDDWEHSKQRLTALNIEMMEASGEFTESEIRPRLHCSSFFGSKRGFFNEQEISQLKASLVQDREVEWINEIADAFLFSYLTFRGPYSIFNYTLSERAGERTGNCADADPFVELDNVLYNEQGRKPIHRIHYMNFPPQDFAKLSQGEDMQIPHKDVFLHYRFLKNPEDKPTQLHQPKLGTKIERFGGKAISKIKRWLG